MMSLIKRVVEKWMNLTLEKKKITCFIFKFAGSLSVEPSNRLQNPGGHLTGSLKRHDVFLNV